MYRIQVVAQMGNQFTADLFQNDKHIGGIGNDINGVYVNLREELSVQEMGVLMTYISNLDLDFKSLPVTIRHLNAKKQIGLTKDDIETILEELAKYRKENGV